MDSVDWKTQWTPEKRERIVNRIIEVLKKHIRSCGPQEIIELRIIAAKFEEKVFSRAVSPTDYLRQIAMKTVILENKAQNTLTSLPAANTTPLESGHLMFDINTNDWRLQISPDAHCKIFNKIMETLKKHFSCSGPEGLNELYRIATKFENKIFTTASSQIDYLQKIFSKMLIMETKTPAQATCFTSLPAANNTTPLYQSGHLIDNGNSRPSLLKIDSGTNTGDWRTQLPPDSRQRNVNKIMESLNKYFPNSGQEGINELMRIAASFEEFIFKTTINQVDYFRKISFKMHMMEEGACN